MPASRLSIYNGALRWLQERKLADLNENRESRRYMDDEYDDNILDCLTEGNWNFAMRSAQFSPETTVAPQFGYLYCFKKPSDWDHTYQVSANQAFDPLLRAYTDQNGYWYAYWPILYVRYVSIDASYGFNLAGWTPLFTHYVEARLAWLVAGRITGKASLVPSLEKLQQDFRANAVNSDSQDLPPGKPPAGTWALARAPRLAYDDDCDDLPLPGGAQNYQPPPQDIVVIVTDDGTPIETDDGSAIIPDL